MKSNKRTVDQLEFQSAESPEPSALPVGAQVVLSQQAPIDLNDLFGEFLPGSSAVCFVKGADGQYLYINQSFESIFKVNAADLIGHTDQSWLPEEVATRLTAHDKTVIESGVAKEMVESLPLPDGSLSHWLVIKFPCRDADGRKLLGGIAFDITEFQTDKQLRRQTELLELILNNIGDPVIAVDQAGKLLLFNPAAIRLYGMGILGTSSTKRGDRYGLFLADGLTPYPKDQLPLVRAIKGETVDDLEIFVRTPDLPGGAILSAKAQPILDIDGKLKGGAAVFRDITASKRAEEEMQLMIRQLKEARDEAIHASELKSQFVSNISHELRTPMSGVLGMTELLLGMSIDPEQRELANYVYESAQNLLSVLNELLDFSRLEAGKLTLEHSSFAAALVVDDVTGSVQLAAGRKGLELITTIDAAVPSQLSGDVRRIKQVLLHFVQNAIKFTEKGSVTIHVMLDRKESDLCVIRFSVTDTGIGIAKDIAANIFVPFVQADGSSTRKYGGVGLGLTISKRLVKLMSGSLGVNSQEGHGSTFWFEIPLARIEEER